MICQLLLEKNSQCLLKNIASLLSMTILLKKHVLGIHSTIILYLSLVQGIYPHNFHLLCVSHARIYYCARVHGWSLNILIRSRDQSWNKRIVICRDLGRGFIPKITKKRTFVSVRGWFSHHIKHRLWFCNPIITQQLWYIHIHCHTATTNTYYGDKWNPGSVAARLTSKGQAKFIKEAEYRPWYYWHTKVHILNQVAPKAISLQIKVMQYLLFQSSIVQ